jgi:hypothetical protein
VAQRTLEAAPDQDRYSLTDLCKRYGVSEATIKKLIRQGKFLRPLRVAGRKTQYWAWEDVYFMDRLFAYRHRLRPSPPKGQRPAEAPKRADRAPKRNDSG